MPTRNVFAPRPVSSSETPPVAGPDLEPLPAPPGERDPIDEPPLLPAEPQRLPDKLEPQQDSNPPRLLEPRVAGGDQDGVVPAGYESYADGKPSAPAHFPQVLRFLNAPPQAGATSRHDGWQPARSTR